MSRQCKNCESWKPDHDFVKWSSSFLLWCSSCRESDKEGWRTYNDKRIRLKNKYGVDLAKLPDLENAKCECCGILGSVVIDHCRESGKFRGLICGRCNSSTFGDNIELMKMRIEYLERGTSSEYDYEDEEVPAHIVKVSTGDYKPLYSKWIKLRNNRCEEWDQFRSFQDWSIEAGWTKGMSLVLRSGATYHSPDNSKWIKDRVSASVSMRKEVKIEAWGESKSWNEWSSDKRFVADSIHLAIVRVTKGWTYEDAMSKPKELPAKQYEIFNERKTLWQWAKDPRAKCNYYTLANRVKSGWELEKALCTTPGA